MEKLIMKTIQQDVLEIAIYDENGKFLNEIKFGKEVELKSFQDSSNKQEGYYLYVRDAVQDMNMLELLGEKIDDNKSDFEKDSFSSPEVNTVRFSVNPKSRKLKVVGTGIDYSLDTAEVEHDIKIIFPNVELVVSNDFVFESGQVHEPIYEFKVLPFNENGDLYEMQFKKRK